MDNPNLSQKAPGDFPDEDNDYSDDDIRTPKPPEMEQAMPTFGLSAHACSHQISTPQRRISAILQRQDTSQAT